MAKKGTDKAASAKRAQRTGRPASGGGKRAAARAEKPAAARSASKRPGAPRKPAAPHIAAGSKSAPGASVKSNGKLAAVSAPAADAPEVIRIGKNASGLTKEEMRQFKDILLAKRAQINGDLSGLRGESAESTRREAAGDLSSMPIHMADLGSDNFEMELTFGLLEGERAVLNEIDDALERMRAGTYGVCMATGKPIGKARLRAKPWAKYCYEYTLAQERGRSHRL